MLSLKLFTAQKSFIINQRVTFTLDESLFERKANIRGRAITVEVEMSKTALIVEVLTPSSEEAKANRLCNIWMVL